MAFPPYFWTHRILRRVDCCLLLLDFTFALMKTTPFFCLPLPPPPPYAVATEWIPETGFVSPLFYRAVVLGESSFQVSFLVYFH